MSAMASAELNLTERRLIVIELVHAGRVTYDPAQAAWFVDDEQLGNWDRRTLTELRTAGLIASADPKKISKVSLTELGKSSVEGLPE